MTELPDLSGRALAATRIDRALYVDRPTELKRVRASLERRSNILVYGERGAGKTSFLHRVELLARDLKMKSVFVDASPAPDVESLVGLIRWRLGRAPVVNPLGVVAASFVAREVRGEAEQTVELIKGLAGDEKASEPVVVLLDEPQRHVAHDLFGRLRDEVWQLPFVWVVGVDAESVPSVLQPPADAFFGTRIELGPLPPDASVQLLKRRVGSEKRIADLGQLADAAGGNPRRLIELARQLVIDRRTPKEIAARRMKADAAIDLLGTPARRMVEVLRDRGSISASDKEVLERLGWTRNRATQVLNQLEEAELVTATYEKGGRRKLYTLSPRMK